MPKKKPDPADVLRAIATRGDDLLVPDCPEELVDAELRAAGRSILVRSRRGARRSSRTSSRSV